MLCKVTITTADDDLCAKLEPGAPPASRRLAAIARLSGAGIFTGVLLMPVLPFLEDSDANIQEIVKRAADSGARFIYPAFGVTLRQNQREWFLAKLEETFPGQGLAARYIDRFGSRYECRSPRARALWECFADACQQRGILYKMPEIIRGYKGGYGDRQLSLFSKME